MIKTEKKYMSGDILKFSEVDTAIVIWNEKYAYFMVKPIQEYYFDSDVLGQALEYNDNVEKIGNIYDNPELLGGE
nr:MAG TPA: YopX protein [Caudoviricetes sp.]